LLGLLDAIDGRNAQGIARGRAALGRCEGRNFYPGFQALTTRVVVATHAVAGDPEGGLELCERALELRSTPLWDPEFRRARAAFLPALGRPYRQRSNPRVNRSSNARYRTLPP